MALIVVGVCLALVVGELALRIVGELAFRAYARYRTKDAWLDVHPELGYLLNRDLPWVNALGIRERPLTPKEGRARILVLGDSVAFSGDRRSFPRVLEERLRARPESGQRPVEVINAAIPGYTTHQEVLWYELFGRRVEPDVVLLQFCLNDLHRIQHGPCADRRKLCTTPNVWADFTEVRAGWIRRSYVLSLAVNAAVISKLAIGVLLGTRYRFEARPHFSRAWKDDAWDEIRELLRRLKDRAARDGARLAVLVFPLGDQLRPEYLARNRDYVLKPQRKLAEIAGDLGIPMLDLFPVFHGHREYLYDDVHLTREAHALVAEEIRGFLLRQGLL